MWTFSRIRRYIYLFFNISGSFKGIGWLSWNNFVHAFHISAFLLISITNPLLLIILLFTYYYFSWCLSSERLNSPGSIATLILLLIIFWTYWFFIFMYSSFIHSVFFVKISFGDSVSEFFICTHDSSMLSVFLFTESRFDLWQF